MATEDVMNANRLGPTRWVLGLAVFLPGVLAVRADEGLKVRAVLEGGPFRVASLAFSPDGKTLASASYDKTVILWAIKPGWPKTTLSGHTRPVYCIAFSPDGKTLASGSEDKTIKLWDVATGQERATLEGGEVR